MTTAELTTGAPKTRVLLLVEDNPGDAQLVAELLADAGRDNYQILHAIRMAEAVQKLQTHPVDVVVLDLSLPDCGGVESVRIIRRNGGHIPIVVLTGSDDDELAHACIDAGAQDYLPKMGIDTQSLRRAIGYAITRIREAQVRELQISLARYRALSSATQGTTVTAALAGSGAVSVRNPEGFAQLVREYATLLDPTGGRIQEQRLRDRASMERIVTSLGDAGGGPRDLLDVHVSALEGVVGHSEASGSGTLVFEARLLALEMMGLLVDYYRVGHRRRFAGGA